MIEDLGLWPPERRVGCVLHGRRFPQLWNPYVPENEPSGLNILRRNLAMLKESLKQHVLRKVEPIAKGLVQGAPGICSGCSGVLSSCKPELQALKLMMHVGSDTFVSNFLCSSGSADACSHALCSCCSGLECCINRTRFGT